MLKQLKLAPPMKENVSLEKLRIIENASPQIQDNRRLYRIQFQTSERKAWQEMDNFAIFPEQKN